MNGTVECLKRRINELEVEKTVASKIIKSNALFKQISIAQNFLFFGKNKFVENIIAS